MMSTSETIIIGAGPYGLSAAAHLRAAGVETRVFGEPMGFWERQMPAGMFLRSYREASHIADPERALTLDAYERASRRDAAQPVPLDHFVQYGQWFGRQVVPDLDTRRVERIDAFDGGFRLRLHDGETLRARRVVIAAGIAAFARRPPQFAAVTPERATHASEHESFARFAGKRVVVAGGGQSALESAALLHEAGATVEVIARTPAVHWLRYGSGSRLHAMAHSSLNPLRPLMFPASDIGPPGLNWLVDGPHRFNRVPTRALRERVARRAIRPAGSGWLRPRFATVPITVNTAITRATTVGDRLHLALSDGTTREVDHVLLATGYAVDIRHYPFLTPELLQTLDRVNGYPRLTAGFESSVRGLHFLGAPAAESFGPLMRFVAGTGYAARALTRDVTPAIARRASILSVARAGS